jgi:bacterioferritin-associated ferredoxin
MPLDCVCKGISSAHTLAALEWKPETPDELYALALGEKKSDPKAKITGLENKNATGFNCGRCRDIFVTAVQGEKPPANVVIMMKAITSSPARTGSCGNDCNSCAPEVQLSGCAPAA